MAEPSILFKRLLKKHMEGLATTNEEATLRIMWDLYDDDEIVSFIEEIQPELPAKVLEGKVDSEAIAEAIIRKGRQEETVKQKIIVLRVAIWAAACILVFIAINILNTLREQNSPNNILCADTKKGDIPTKDFYCTFQLDNTQRFVIDSNYKGMLRRYGKMAVLLRPGVVQYKTMPYSVTADSVTTAVQQISTDDMQQYIVELPDRTRIRLNAMTSIKIYPDRFDSKKQFIELEKGEIYVEGNQRSDVLLEIKTPAVTFIATGSYFDTRIDSKGSLLAVQTGEVTVRNRHGEEIVRECYDLSHYTKEESPQEKVAINTYNISGIDLVTNWRRTERVYKDVQLDYFVADMAQWYGFKFTSLDCLPKKKISTVICYRATIKDFIAVIRNNGANIWKTSNGYAFCDPESKSSGQMAVLNR
ncbi:FecR domain-containing protein [Niabella hirudinis]|uniref:FecR domain-containing protein n=1 Tax=Niabella hirudinis TaxID=1285929 RepID=UPI003EB7C610